MNVWIGPVMSTRAGAFSAAEGALALYRGYPPTLLRAIAMNTGQMTTFDEVRCPCNSMFESLRSVAQWCADPSLRQAKERFDPIFGEGIKTNAAASIVATFAANTLSLPVRGVLCRPMFLEFCTSRPTFGSLL